FAVDLGRPAEYSLGSARPRLGRTAEGSFRPRILTAMRTPICPLLRWISGGPLSTVSFMRYSARPPLGRTAVPFKWTGARSCPGGTLRST
ncbi:unnamed protein product, partial [Ixodes pacificus]